MRKLNTNEWVAVGVAVAFVGYSLFGGTIMGFFRGANTTALSTTSSTDVVSGSQNTETIQVGSESNTATVINSNNNKNSNPMNDVVVNDIVNGTGKEVQPGDTLSVNYLLKLSDGTVVQDSKVTGQPFKFVLGAGQVIAGWEKGFMGMKVGGSRTIIIPPQFGYGDTQAGPIPPNSTLVFTVELLDATKGTQ